MKRIVFIIIIFLTLTNVSFSQGNTYNKDIVSYLEVNGTERQYAKAVDELFIMLSKRHADVPNTVWKDLDEVHKTRALKSIKALLVTPYRLTFTHEDIKTMLEFYNTEAGKQLRENPTEMTKAQKAAAGDFYATAAGQKLLANKEKLERKVSQTSEIWSRDLYRMVTEDLEERGYSVN